MAIRKTNWTEIGRIIAILLEAVSGALDRICDRAERKAGIVTPEVISPQETQLGAQLKDGFDEVPGG